MHISDLHPWALAPADAIRLQRELGAKVAQHPPLDLSRARFIAGMDVSSSKDDPLLTAGIVVWDRQTGTVVETAFARAAPPLPYIPGLLSFREAPALLEAAGKLAIEPDAFLVDGHGRAHPRRLGIAAHIGLFLDRPTVGVAKSLLTGDGDDPGNDAGDFAPLLDGEETIGRIVRTRDNVSPVFVSVGNRITLDSAMDLVLSCTRGYRLPEPTRLAHLHVNLVRTTGKGLETARQGAML